MMDFYRAYNVNAEGKTLSFKGFPAESDRDACMQASTIKENGNWHTLDLRTGVREVDCAALSGERLGRQVFMPTE